MFLLVVFLLIASVRAEELCAPQNSTECSNTTGCWWCYGCLPITQSCVAPAEICKPLNSTECSNATGCWWCYQCLSRSQGCASPHEWTWWETAISWLLWFAIGIEIIVLIGKCFIKCSQNCPSFPTVSTPPKYEEVELRTIRIN